MFFGFTEDVSVKRLNILSSSEVGRHMYETVSNFLSTLRILRRYFGEGGPRRSVYVLRDKSNATPTYTNDTKRPSRKGSVFGRHPVSTNTEFVLIFSLSYVIRISFYQQEFDCQVLFNSLQQLQAKNRLEDVCYN